MENVEKLIEHGRKLVLDNLKWASAQAEIAAGRFEKATERYAADGKRSVEAAQEAIDHAVETQREMGRRAAETVEKTIDLWKDALRSTQAQAGPTRS